jgi:putative MATE family efflux protein
MIAMIFQSITGVTDIYFLGRINDPNAQAAIGIFAVLSGYLGAFNTIVGNGSISVISQYYGSCNYEKANKATAQTILLKIIGTYVLVIPCIIFIKPLLLLFGAEGEALNLGVRYGIIILTILPLMNAGYTFNTALRAAGDAVTPMYLMLSSLIVNLILNIVFINTLSLGIVGVALATAISQIFLFIAGLWVYSNGTKLIKIDLKSLLKPELNYMKNIFEIGLPSGLQGILASIANSIIIKIIASFGMSVVASYTVATRTAGLAMMPISGLSFATSVIVGQNIAARKDERALAATRTSVVIALILTVSLSVIFSINPLFFLNIFSKDSEVLMMGKNLLPFFAFLQIIAALISIYNAPLLGTGKLKPLFYISIISVWLIQIPFTFMLKGTLGLNGIWISIALSNIINLYLSYRLFKSRNWISSMV